MSLADPPAVSLEKLCTDISSAARQASRELVAIDTEVKNRWLFSSADALLEHTASILSANQVDLDAAQENNLTDSMIDRLRLNPERLEGIAAGLREIAALADPVGEVLDGFTRPGGLRILKRRVPLGVVFFIYESRPNVTADAAAICVKSGNAVILRGGKEAIHSSRAIVDVLTNTAKQVGLPDNAVQLVPTIDREAVGHFLKLDSLIDVTIPRGGEGLIRRVAAEASMPVIKHYDGNCHVYVDAHANIEMAVKVIENAKCQRMGVCNACESLLIHQDIARQALPAIVENLSGNGVSLVGDSRSQEIDKRIGRATEEDFSAEYLGPQISVAIVDDISQAISHINQHGSHHTDAILTEDMNAARRFTDEVDSSAVMVNASTRFNDGGVFGLGAEIGISTDKFHARGPCGMRELTTYKYIVTGEGSVRT
ncbi:MAG: glutamate-5-semialdehyde dehydrogenase [Planctomycetota bacterium]